VKKLDGKTYPEKYTGKDVQNAQRIYQILINAEGQQIAKREIVMRLGYRKLFQDCYDHLIGKGAISEWGSGKKGDPIVVRLGKPDYLK
jgi:hypothetical protein